MESLQRLFDLAHPFGHAVVTLEPSGFRFAVEVAETPEQRARGMVGRTFSDEVPAMLFVQPVETYAKFHMRDVSQPLVLAIFDKDGRFLESMGMTANSSTMVHARGFKYALEVEPSFFKSMNFDGQVLVVSSP